VNKEYGSVIDAVGRACIERKSSFVRARWTRY